jgi:hypothetical protein
MDLQGLEAAMAVPDGLRGLIRAVRREGLQPGDERVRSLWNMLRQRQLLGRSPWLKVRLRFFWERGLAVRPRPRTTRRMVRLLRGWGILPPLAGRSVGQRRMGLRPLRRVAVRPVQPMAARPVRPVAVRPVARAMARR